jgi:BASS family bile acid:Na+ symporter
MVSRSLCLLSRHATVFLAAGAFLGLAWPAAAHVAAPLLAPTVFVLLTAALVRLDWDRAAAIARRPGRAIIIVIWLLAASPALAAVIVSAFDLPDALATAIVLMAAAPPIMSSIAFALLLDLDAPLATVAVIAATMIAPLTLPPLALQLLGFEIKVSTAAFMLRLALLVFGAVAAAAALRVLVPRPVRERRAPEIDGIAVVMMVLFCVAIMDGVTAKIVAQPAQVALYAAAAFAANLTLQATGAAAFFWLGGRPAATIALVSGNRNMGLLLAVLAGTADADLVLYFAIGQLPIYILPALLRPLYRRAGLPARKPRPNPQNPS